jgi:CTP synthase
MRLREIGLQPDILLCRTDRSLNEDIKRKIGLFCNVPPNHVIEAKNVPTIYEVPLAFEHEDLGELIKKKLNLKCGNPDMTGWEKFVHKIYNPEKEITIAICGKYTQLPDSYKSIIESFVHAGVENNVKVNVEWIDSEEVFPRNAANKLAGIDGLLVPGGFGDRGIEGMINAIQYVREKKIPFFGICLGLQTAVIEFSRNVCDLKKSNSTEFVPRIKHNVIDLMPEQRGIVDKGATMRLGEYPCVLKKNTHAHKAYGEIVIKERHRHRLEVNNEYKSILSENGMSFVGLSPDEKLVEMIEIKNHPWFLGCQFHPELKSRAVRAHPLFREFVKAAKKYNISRGKNKTVTKTAAKKKTEKQ